METREDLVTLAFPTEGISLLFRQLRENLKQLQSIIAPHSSRLCSADRRSYSAAMAQAESLLARSASATVFFLHYPTHRLSSGLIKLAADMATTVAWLAQNPPNAPDSCRSQYAACCEAIQESVRDWRLAVQIETALHSLGYETPETLH